LEHLKTESEVIKYFLAENRQNMTALELKTYEHSLDCALATIIACEKRGIDYPESYEKVKAAVQEPGDFWAECLRVGVEKLGIQTETYSIGHLMAIHALAVDHGITWLLDAFQEGL
jgi:hypothetical protein